LLEQTKFHGDDPKVNPLFVEGAVVPEPNRLVLGDTDEVPEENIPEEGAAAVVPEPNRLIGGGTNVPNENIPDEGAADPEPKTLVVGDTDEVPKVAAAEPKPNIPVVGDTAVPDEKVLVVGATGVTDPK